MQRLTFLMTHPRKWYMISHSFCSPDGTIHFSRAVWGSSVMPECFSEGTISLQAWVNQRLLLSHLYSLKKHKTCTLQPILIKSLLFLSCFVKHSHLRPLIPIFHWNATIIYLRKSSKCLTRARRFLSGICIFPRISGSFTGRKARHRCTKQETDEGAIEIIQGEGSNHWSHIWQVS